MNFKLVEVNGETACVTGVNSGPGLTVHISVGTLCVLCEMNYV